MEALVVDTSVIKRSEEIKEKIGFDFLSKLRDNYHFIISTAVKEECIQLGLSLEGLQVKESNYSKKIWQSLSINSNKNLGEAECIKLCQDNQNYVFLTDDYLAWKKGRKFLGDRSGYFLLFFPKLNILSSEEKLKILETRTETRKISKKVYKLIKSKIKEQKN